jgi:glycosyltransferase involved in cell wall biosynthesis
MMNNKPLFSVLIANYNNGKYLQEAVDSVINQTYNNWEIVILDDASTDNSNDVYKVLEQNEKIRICKNNENKGVGYTKNKLCELAKGEIAGFLDADDALVDTAIEIMINEHINNKSLSLIYSQFFICDNNLNTKSISKASRRIETTYLDDEIGSISHFATFKMSHYCKTEGIDKSLIMAEDKDLYYKLEEVGQIKFIETPLYYYRINPKGVSRENRYETDAWGIIAKYNALKRRNQNPIRIIVKLIESERKTIDFYENSNDYKIGKILLSPFRNLKLILKNEKNS